MFCFLNGNKLATLWGVKFVLQYNEVATNATIDTLVIELNQEKYEKFLSTNSPSRSNKCKGTFRVVRKVNSSCSRKVVHSGITKEAGHLGVSFQFSVLEEADTMITQSTTLWHTSIGVASPTTNERSLNPSVNQSVVPLTNRGRKQVFYQAINAKWIARKQNMKESAKGDSKPCSRIMKSLEAKIRVSSETSTLQKSDWTKNKVFKMN